MDIVDIIWRAYSQNRDEKRAREIDKNIHFCAGEAESQLHIVGEADRKCPKSQEQREKDVIEFVLRFVDEVGNFRQF